MFTRTDSLIRFQRALNHYREMIFTQDMTFFPFLTMDSTSRTRVQSFQSFSKGVYEWHADIRNLRIGDIIIVQDTKIAKSEWRLAQVCKAGPGADGKGRDGHTQI